VKFVIIFYYGTLICCAVFVRICVIATLCCATISSEFITATMRAFVMPNFTIFPEVKVRVEGQNHRMNIFLL